MDVILQIFKRSICLGTRFFESLAKKPPTTMDDLFRHANKYSMLKNDIRAATQQVLVQGPPNREQGERRPPITPTPLTLTYEKLLPMICDGESSHGHGPRVPIAPVKAIINYIHGGPLDDEYNSRRKKQRLLRAATVREHVSSIRPRLARESVHPIDRAIVFPPIDPTQVLQPHRDALILTMGIGDLISADLLQVSVVKQIGFIPSSLENPGRILSGFNGASTTLLGDIILPIQARPVTLNILFSVVEDLSPFNAILRRTWLHNMKVIPSTYHQMVSFITQDGQVDLYGS
ncbi:hypothetical protein AAG906_038758 [Vitis piasezkii]